MVAIARLLVSEQRPAAGDGRWWRGTDRSPRTTSVMPWRRHPPPRRDDSWSAFPCAPGSRRPRPRDRRRWRRFRRRVPRRFPARPADRTRQRGRHIEPQGKRLAGSDAAGALGGAQRFGGARIKRRAVGVLPCRHAGNLGAAFEAWINQSHRIELGQRRTVVVVMFGLLAHRQCKASPSQARSS